MVIHAKYVVGKLKCHIYNKISNGEGIYSFLLTVVMVCTLYMTVIFSLKIVIELASPTAKKSQTFLSIHPTFFGMLLKHL